MRPAPTMVCIENGTFVENTWLVIDDATHDAVVIDPGEEHARILAEIDRRELTVKAIWLTHAHIDHIWGVDAVRAATGAPVSLHPADRRWYDSLPEQGKMFGIDDLPRLTAPDHEFADGDLISLGAFRFDVRHTPGHAPGHVAFIGHGVAIAGDVLFQDSIGRTDLAGGNHTELLESIQRVLMVLPDETRVLPGHGPETTVGRERQLNPFLRAA